MTTVVIFAQILAICTHAYLLSLEKKYCGHLDWWSDAGAIVFIVFSCVPVAGLFFSIAGCIDYARNITKELTKDRT